VKFNDSFHKREPCARALNTWIQFVEELENPLMVFRRDAAFVEGQQGLAEAQLGFAGFYGDK